MEALKFLADGHGKTSKDLAAHLGISLTLASDVLGGKLFRFMTKREGQGDLVDRRYAHVEGFRRPLYVYSINDRGLARLEYYRSIGKK